MSPERPSGRGSSAGRDGSGRFAVLLGIAILGGAVGSLAFAPVDLVVFAVVGPALGLWAAARSGTAGRGALCGLGYGLGFTLLTFRWLLTLDLVAYLLFPPLQALYYVLPGVVAARTARHGRWVWVLSAAAAWTLAEALRARFPLSGFEWGQLGLSTAGGPVRQAAAIVGTLGVAALLAALAAAIVALVLFGGARRWVPAASVAVALLVTTLAGTVRYTTPAGSLDVAVVQVTDPCPDAFAVDCPNYGRRLLEQYAAGTAALDTTPDVIFWGEDALSGGATLDDVGQRLVAVTGRLPAPLLAGTSTSGGPGRFFRWNVLYSPDGEPLDTYAKRVPVPFGEYVPLRDVLGGISDVGRLVPSDMVPGTEPAPVEVPTDAGDAPLGTLVSWEVTFSRLTRDVADGADGLATLTTVASYGTSSVSDQLLAAAQLRAAELQKPMVVAATTGRSAFIAPDGARLATSALFEADRLVGQMALRSGSTPFARYGDLPVIVVAVGVLIAVGLLRRRRPSRTEPVARDDGHTRHDQDAADVRTAP